VTFRFKPEHGHGILTTETMTPFMFVGWLTTNWKNIDFLAVVTWPKD
jgi:hypothetical protein